MSEGRVRRPQGGLASVALFATAYANPSLYGSAFLFLALTWAVFCISNVNKRRVAEVSKALWASVCALSFVALVLQIGVQLAFVAQAPGILRPSVVRVLEILGFPVITSLYDFFIVIGPLSLVLFFGAQQAQAVRYYSAALAQLASDGRELGPLSLQQTIPIRVSSFTNAGVFAALSLAAAALCVPTLLSAPYTLTIGGALLCIANGNRITHSISPGTEVALQVYAAVHLSVLYTWQWALSYASWLRPVADSLGLYVLRDAPTTVDFWIESIQFVALGVLVLSLGYGFRRRAPRGLTIIARLLNVHQITEGEESDYRTPLLATVISPGDDNQNVESSHLEQQQQQEEQQMYPGITPAGSGNIVINQSASAQPPKWEIQWAQAFLPASFELGLAAFTAGSASSGVIAAATCLLSMIQPSVIGCMLLMTGLVLLISSKARLPRPIGQLLLYSVLLWMVTCYLAASLSGIVHSTPLLEAIGVHFFHSGAPLVAIVLVAASISAHLMHSAHNGDRAEDRGLSTTGNAPDVAWAMVLNHAVQLAYAAGSVLLPGAVFVLGISRYNVINAGFLLAACVPALQATLKFQPRLDMILPANRQRHYALRTYLTIALFSMYGICVGGLEGFNHVLQPDQAAPVLRALGLWGITPSDMLPVLGVLILARLHAASAAGVAPVEDSSQLQVPTVGNVPTWRPAWLVHAARKIAACGSFLIAIALYIIVILDCDIAALGLAYLSLALIFLATHAEQGRWQFLAGTDTRISLSSIMLGLDSELFSGPARHAVRRAVLLDSPVLQWLPTAILAAVAAVDLLVQAALPALVALDWPVHIPDNVLDFLNTVIGVDASSQGKALAARLLRPGFILGGLAVYRGMYCLGTLHRQLQRSILQDADLDRRSLAAQWTLLAFFKRFSILHASKIVTLLAFASSMQTPSMLGWTLVVGTVIFSPFIGSSKFGAAHRQRGLRLLLSFTQAVSSFWLLSQYAALVPIVKQALAPNPYVEDLLSWVGIDTYAPSTIDVLEKLLRLKFLLLVALPLKLRSLEWGVQLPAEVRNRAVGGSACPLFWPTAPDCEPPIEETPTIAGIDDGIRGASALDSARLALHSAAGRARSIAQQALQAVDWPSPRQDRRMGAEISSVAANEGADATRSCAPSTGASPNATVASLSLKAFRFALQDCVDRWFAEWSLEISLFTLVLAAFLAANALSLGFMAIVGVGMAAPPGGRQALWRWITVPTLGAALVWQYSELVGFPPKEGLSWAPDSSDDLLAWLGLTEVDPAAVWALFLSFGAAVLRLHYDSWKSASDTGNNNNNTGSPDTEDLTSALLQSSTSQDEGFVRERTRQLWAPLSFNAQATWQWHDWIRYAAYRWYMDLVLIAVVALCTLDNDIVHAGYLALALFFFRARIALRARRNALFFWLPVYNFTVMVVVLAYQAPFEDFWDWPLDEGRACTLAHLLGLYKLRPSTGGGDQSSRPSLLSWGYQGAAADLVLWALIRLQTHIFSSETYSKVIAVVQSEEEMKRDAGKADIAAWKDRQAAAAVEESRQRAARALRISRIKKGVDRTLGRFGAGINPTVLDYAFLEHNHERTIGDGGDGPSEATAVDTAHALDSPPPPPAPLRRRPTASRRDSACDQPPSSSYSQQQLTEYEREVEEASKADLTANVMGVSAAARDVQNNGQGSWYWKAYSWATVGLRRADRRESALAYAFFVAAYLSDLSLLTLVLPVSAFLYALVTPRPSRAYWQAVLLYCEILIVVSYAYQVPTRLRCGFVTVLMEQTAEMLGIHSNAARCIPLFLVYLSVLTHTYSIISRHEAGRRVAAAAAEADSSASLRQTATGSDLEAGSSEKDEVRFADRSSAALPLLPQIIGSQDGSGSGALVAEFVLRAFTVCEAPPSFVIVDMSLTDMRLKSGSEIEIELQRRLDEWRRHDLDVRGQDGRRREEASGTDIAEPRHFPRLSEMGCLQLRFHSFIDNSAISTDEVTEKKNGDGSGGGCARAVFEVFALPATPENSPGISTSLGWPLRSLNPAADTAATLLRGDLGDHSTALQVVATEAHSRQAQDWYAATACLDMLAFIFVALYYNRMVPAAGSLSEITAQHVVPLGYLLTLIVLFTIVVLDRVVYTLGNVGGKAVLHIGEMLLYFWYCSTLVWADPYGGGSSALPRGHLRALLLIKCCSFTLGALQLRAGYPPPASYSNGMGRHTFVFMRSISVPASLAFHAFTAVPFLYEMRQLLDWSCTPTTLTLYDWLKLEDINMSLYFSAVMRKAKAWKPLGIRQPRYLKFFQGGLLFSALVLLLWVPLLVFSTGNPTYTVPSIAAFSVNVTLEASSPAPVPGSRNLKARSRLFLGGDRGSWMPWAGSNDTLPSALASNYIASQLQLLCAPPDADNVWSASRPAQSALEDLLGDEASSVALSFGWNVLRDSPPLSDHGGPLCEGSAAVGLAWTSRIQLRDILRGEGERQPVPLLRIDDYDGNTTTALFPVFWLIRGDSCESRPLESSDLSSAERFPGRRQHPPDFAWADRWVACNTSLEGAGDAKQEHSSMTGVWWRLKCHLVDSQGNPADSLTERDSPEGAKNNSNTDGADGRATCGESFSGPQLVAVLDRVQGGIIGATLTKFGVIGLYTVFVYGIGRFLRLSVTNLRMRIMYEDLPTTKRLVALCQDIYIARAEGLLELEEELYGALLAVYRLSSVLYELSKKRQ